MYIDGHCTLLAMYHILLDIILPTEIVCGSSSSLLHIYVFSWAFSTLGSVSGFGWTSVNHPTLALEGGELRVVEC